MGITVKPSKLWLLLDLVLSELSADPAVAISVIEADEGVVTLGRRYNMGGSSAQYSIRTTAQGNGITCLFLTLGENLGSPTASRWRARRLDSVKITFPRPEELLRLGAIL